MHFLKPLLFVIASSTCCYSQQKLSLRLVDAINLAQRNSLDYKIAVNLSQSSHWNFQSYKAALKPRITLTGTLPDYYRTINMITLPNGQNNFVIQNVDNSGVNVNLTQNIAQTGGSISVSSALRRIDNFGSVRSTAYTAVPFTLRYFQDNVLYNDFKWQKQIEPLKLEEAKKAYVENLQDIAYKAESIYFEYLLADIQHQLAQQNLQNIDTLIKVTNARFEIGTVQLNDVLHSKVNLLNAKRNLSNTNLNVQIARQNLIRFLALENDVELDLRSPDSLLFFEIDPAIALEKARKSRKFTAEFRRRRLQAEQEVARIRSQTGPRINTQINVGVTQRGSDISQAYQDLLRNQSVILGIYLPIEDWGVTRANRKRAEANLDLENNMIKQSEITIEQEIYYQVNKWNTQKEQMQIAGETRELAEKRYELAMQRYSTGGMTYTDFNNAQFEKDRAIIDYITNLHQYWSSYHLIRKLTLFDFVKNKPIDVADIIVN